MTYAEKLKDPRWQKKRLFVMQRANFTCQCCGSEEKTLNVHHVLYSKGRDPWDYKDHELQCLCEQCHRNAEDIREGILSMLADYDVGYENFPEMLLSALKCIVRVDCSEHEGLSHPFIKFSAWMACAAYPDLLAEANERYSREMLFTKWTAEEGKITQQQYLDKLAKRDARISSQDREEE